jgi:hypothetical protein
MLKEIATKRIVDRGEIFTSNVSGKRAIILGNHTDRGTDFVTVRYQGEDIPRMVLAKNFGLYNG